MMLIHGLRQGKFASEKLTQAKTLTTVGMTSRGCFLQTDTGWTIFLTEETIPGPITVNLPPGAITALRPAVGHQVGMNEGILRFSSKACLGLNATTIWQPSPPPANSLQNAGRQKAVMQTIRLVLDQNAPGGFSGVLPDLIPLLPFSFPLKPAHGLFTEKLAGLIQCLQYPANEGNNLSSRLSDFLGQGSGLTPSGDDFLLGLFLTWQRWQPVLDVDHRLLMCAQNLRCEVWQKTTCLSASLSECALVGHADQRLILALDGIMTSDKILPDWLKGIQDWGHSSGYDALAGMLLGAISPNQFGHSRI